MKAVLTVGISCSGKSTYAAKLVEHGFREINRDWIRFNIVKPGEDWRTYKFNSKNEDEVTKIQGQMIMESWESGEDIVISDTNLAEGRRDALIQKLEDLGYDVDVEVLTVPLVEAYKRDTYRLNGVGRDVIYRQHLQMNEIVGRPVYKPNPELQDAIIVDVDGTIAEMHDRGPFEWEKVGQDKPRDFILDMVADFSKRGKTILIVSGRSDECNHETRTWLNENLGVFGWDELHMRAAGDFRKDDAVKEEIFWTKLADRYNIQAVIDDRPQVVRLWHDLRIPNVICVGNPYLEF